MGARAQVKINDTGVYLYTHWGANSIFEDVQEAISKNWRWTDPEYLTRIIFDTMKRSDIDGETGYGIGTAMHGDIERLVVVDCKTQTVEFQEIFAPTNTKTSDFYHVHELNFEDSHV